MREIQAGTVTQTVKDLFLQASFNLGQDVLDALEEGRQHEESPVGQEIFRCLLENATISNQTRIPLCQDTGLGIVFVDLGQDVHVVGGDLKAAVEEGVRQAYEEGYLRKSVCHPLDPRQHRRQHPGGDSLGRGSGGYASDRGRAQRRGKRKHEPGVYAQTGRRLGRHQTAGDSDRR